MTNNKKIIFGLVGDLAAGKGTFSSYVEKNHGAHIYRFSTILRDILKRLYIPQNREHLQNISTLLRNYFGQDVLSKVIAEDATHDTAQLIVIDGIRRPSDIVYLKELPGFHLLYLTAEREIRWKRLVERNENPGDNTKTLEAFIKDEQAEADRLIKDLGQTAELTIVNNDSLEKFYLQIEQILNNIHDSLL